MRDNTHSCEKCFSCGALVQVMDGPVHRYMDACPGCWHVFNLILQKEYSDSEYRKKSRLTTDAYAVQHYGLSTNPQAVRSVNHHLISLCFYFEHKMSVVECDTAFRGMAVNKYNYTWLEPPNNVGIITVSDVAEAITVSQHLDLVEEWAFGAWKAWSWHHSTISNIIDTSYRKKWVDKGF